MKNKTRHSTTPYEIDKAYPTTIKKQIKKTNPRCSSNPISVILWSLDIQSLDPLPGSCGLQASLAQRQIITF